MHASLIKSLQAFVLDRPDCFANGAAFNAPPESRWGSCIEIMHRLTTPDMNAVSLRVRADCAHPSLMTSECPEF